MIHVTPEQRRVVEDILRRFVPHARVVVFGSRVTGKLKPFSDLDLAIDAQDPLSLDTLAALRDAFSESNLPFRVDIVDQSTVSDEFKRVIAEVAEEIQPGGDLS